MSQELFDIEEEKIIERSATGNVVEDEEVEKNVNDLY